jgi:hypothetical protein
LTHSLKDSNVSLKMKRMKERVGVCSLAHTTSKVEGHIGVLGWELGWMISEKIIHTNLHTSNKLVSVWWSTFGAHTNHGHARTHKTQHNLDLGEATTFSLIQFFVTNHKGCIQMSFFPRTPKLGVLKFPKLGNLIVWRAISFCTNIRLKWNLKQSCSPHWELFNNMWYNTYTHIF